MIFGEQFAVIGQDDVESGPDLSVLEAIVHQDDIGRRFFLQQFADTHQPVLTHSYFQFRHPLLHQFGFIADIFYEAELRTGDIPSGLSLIASAQYRNPVFAAQDACDGQHMRGLSGTSCTQIAYQNHRKIKLETAQPSPVVEKVAQAYDQAVQPGERVKEETHPTKLLKTNGLETSVTELQKT